MQTSWAEKLLASILMGPPLLDFALWPQLGLQYAPPGPGCKTNSKDAKQPGKLWRHCASLLGSNCILEQLHQSSKPITGSRIGACLGAAQAQVGAVERLLLPVVDQLLSQAVPVVRHQGLAVIQGVVKAHEQGDVALDREGRQDGVVAIWGEDGY